MTVKICLNKVTKNKMVKRAHMMVRKYGDPLTFMLYTDELSSLIERRGSYGDLRDMAKQAYDYGSLTSTDTNSDQSYNATVDIPLYFSLAAMPCLTPRAKQRSKSSARTPVARLTSSTR